MSPIRASCSLEWAGGTADARGFGEQQYKGHLAVKKKRDRDRETVSTVKIE